MGYIISFIWNTIFLDPFTSEWPFVRVCIRTVPHMNPYFVDNAKLEPEFTCAYPPNT